ncbi:MAG: monofunctional biosynthetic peptidoglycan transglycosylase [Pseudomonadota bacterium]
MRRSMHRTGSRARRRPWWRRAARALLLAGGGFVLASALLVGALRFVAPPGSAFMLARAVDAWRAGETGFRLDQRWVPLSRIAPDLALAAVAAEDQKFPLHHGFDLDAIGGALAERRAGGRVRGASTISQQVAKNLFLWAGRSWLRKGLEVWFTLLIEALWPKSRILEVYLNVAEFGDGIYGAEAAARRYFGRPASDLRRGEAARLAAVLPDPRRMHAGRPTRRVLSRQRWIERQMVQLGPAWLDGVLHGRRAAAAGAQ